MSVVSTLNPPVNDFWSAVIDPAGEVAYFHSNNASAVLKINIKSTQVATWSTTLNIPSTFTATLGTETTGITETIGKISRTCFVVVSSAIAFPVLIVGILAVCLWQLEIIDIAASNGTTWCPPFLLWSCIPWFIARDIWYLGVFVAFVLALIGAVNYTRFTRLPLANQADGYANPTPQAGALSSPDERLYRSITSHGGTISVSAASMELGMPIAQINAGISRLKQAHRIE
jgi:hypothetical protein